MAVAHSSSPLRKLCVGLCLLFYTAHLFLHVSGQEFPVKSIYSDSHQTVLPDPLFPDWRFIVRKVIDSESTVIYTINVTIGNFPVVAQFSTNRILNWALCEKCDPCYPHEGLPIFDPSKSQSYKKKSCRNAKYCKSFPTHGCDDDNKCNVTIVYPPNRKIRGGISSVSFKFSNRGPIVLREFVLACIHEVYGFNQYGTGVMSLARFPHSLVSQLNVGVFSFCLPIKRSTGSLAFGASASDPSPGSITVPLVDPESNLYRIQVSALQVGNGEIIVLHPPNNTYTVSTISPKTYVDSDTSARLITSITAAVRFPVVLNDQYPLCLEFGPMPWKDLNLPSINVQFGTNGTILLHKNNYFLQVEDTVGCITIHGAQEITPVLGSQAMGGRDIRFDLSNNKISFSKHAKC